MHTSNLYVFIDEINRKLMMLRRRTKALCVRGQFNTDSSRTKRQALLNISLLLSTMASYASRRKKLLHQQDRRTDGRTE